AGTSRAELDRELDADFTAARKAAAAEVKDLRRALADRRKELRLVLREVLALRHRVGKGGSSRTGTSSRSACSLSPLALAVSCAPLASPDSRCLAGWSRASGPSPGTRCSGSRPG